jgi:3-isopropylmalate/(R)-2-methylmalate dehydratase small subunit
VARLMAEAEQGANAVFTVDLAAQQVMTPDGRRVPFEIDPFRKHCLLHGLDDIAQTLEKSVSIQAFEERQRVEQPWLYRE